MNALKAKTAVLRERVAGEPLEELLPEAYALAREASVRSTGLRHYDVQIMGGMLLHRGEVVEMRTGEGQNPGRHAAALPQRPGPGRASTWSR
jgi:preprotein translocase subunit SecA